VLAGIAVLVSGTWILKFYLQRKPAQQYTVDEKQKPSTFTRTHVVEDVVQEQNDDGDMLKQGGELNLAYEQLSPAEKINYEILYAKNVCDLLAATVPSGIGFRTLTTRGFTRIEGVTLTSSKELITEMLLAMRRARVDPLPRPMSVIRQSGSGYHFTFAADTRFGLNLRAPFVDLELHHLATSDNLAFMIKKLEQTAEKNNVRLTAKIRKLPEEPDGKYIKTRFGISGVSSYADFSRFIGSLHEERIPCAFDEMKLTAQSKNLLSIEARVLFTTLH
jgi:hypothetical protein